MAHDTARTHACCSPSTRHPRCAGVPCAVEAELYIPRFYLRSSAELWEALFHGRLREFTSKSLLHKKHFAINIDQITEFASHALRGV